MPSLNSFLAAVMSREFPPAETQETWQFDLTRRPTRVLAEVKMPAHTIVVRATLDILVIAKVPIKF